MKPILAVLLFAATASAQSLFLQSEQRVAASPIGMPSSVQRNARIASSDTNHLIAWVDDRGDRFAPRNPSAVFVTRLDPAGHILDSPNLALPLSGLKAIPFWNGREYVVVSDSGSVRISAAGELLDRTARPLAITDGSLQSVVFGGDRALVTLYNKTTGLRFLLYDSSMRLVRGDLKESATAANGNGFISQVNHELRFYDRDMNLLVRKPFSDSWFLYAIASDGTDYLAVGEYFDPLSQQMQLFTMAVTAAGEVRGGGPIYGDPQSGAIRLYWDGVHYQLFYYGEAHLPEVVVPELRAFTIDRDGKLVGGAEPAKLKIYNNSNDLAVGGRDGSQLLVREGLFFPGNIYQNVWTAIAYKDFASFETAAAQPFDYARAAMPNETAVAATAGEVALVAWRMADTTVTDRFALWAARVDRAGHWVDAPIRISDATCDWVFPAVATDGREFLVAWQQPGSVRAVRIAHDGRLLDGQPMILSKLLSTPTSCVAAPPAIAWNGTNYLVIWLGEHENVIYGVRVQADGNVLDPLPGTVAAGAQIGNPQIASNGSAYYVTWTDRVAAVARGTRLDGGAVPIAPELLFNIPSVNALYWSGRQYVALSSSADGVRAIRIPTDGVSPDVKFGSTVAPLAFPLDSDAPHVDCDARGCFTYAIANGLLIATRIDDSGPSVSAAASMLMRVGDARRHPLVFGNDAGALGYLRFGMEPEYAGTWQLFVGTTGAARGGRPVR